MSKSDSAALLTSDDEPELARSGPNFRVPTFAEIYRTYFGFVWSCTRRLGVTEAEIDDVVQEVFIVINGRLSTLQQPESLRSWVYGIVRRTVSTHRRAKRAKVVHTAEYVAQPEMQYPQMPSPQQLAEQSDQVRLLWSLLDKIDPAKREVFVLAELDEMTAPEIASAIEVPLNTVYSRLRAARQELEEALQRHNARTSKRGVSCPT
jgi:RNA polymerase sigma-70 factor (ECF subfamily)